MRKRILIGILVLTMIGAGWSEYAVAQFGGGGAFGQIVDYLKRVATSILPAANNMYNLGSPSKKWAIVYATTYSGVVGTDETYGSGWNGDTGVPEKDDIYDYLHLLDTNDDGDIDTIDATLWATKQGILTNSAGLAGALSDETGTGYVVLNTSPSFVTEILLGDTTYFRTLIGTEVGTGTGYYNTYLGYQAGKATTTGGRNTVIGSVAGPAITDGGYNVAIGFDACKVMTSGASNVVIGADAGQAITNGGTNTFVGYQSGYANTSGSGNAYFGSNAGNLATGDQNVCIGQAAGDALTSGSYNTMVGEGAGGAIGAAASNTYIGYEAARENTGHQNTAVGYHAGYTGDGGHNIFIGYGAGYYETGDAKFILDNGGRTDEATARTNSMFYGIFNADPKLQILAINAQLTTRIIPRITTITTNANPTIDTDICDAVTITAQAGDIASMTTNLSGTPVNFQTLLIRIKDNGTARAIAWGTSYEACGVALPTTTVISKRLVVKLIYDSVSTKWGCVAVAQET